MAERRPVFVLLDAVFTTVVRDGLDPLSTSVAVPRPAPGLIVMQKPRNNDIDETS